MTLWIRAEVTWPALSFFSETAHEPSSLRWPCTSRARRPSSARTYGGHCVGRYLTCQLCPGSLAWCESLAARRERHTDQWGRRPRCHRRAGHCARRACHCARERGQGCCSWRRCAPRRRSRAQAGPGTEQGSRVRQDRRPSVALLAARARRHMLLRGQVCRFLTSVKADV